MNGYSNPRLAAAAVAASAASLGGVAFGAGTAHAAGKLINVGPTSTYKTIGAGIAAAASGDTVSVAPGTYTENVSLKAGVTVTSATAGGAHITGAVAVKNAAGAKLDGFAITNPADTALTVTNSAGAVISNNTVTGSGLQSVDPVPIPPPDPVTGKPYPIGANGHAAVIFNNAGAAAFTGNHVTGNRYHGMLVTGTTGGAVVSGNEYANNADTNPDPLARYANGLSVKAPSVTVLGNSVHDNQDSGIQFYPAGDNGVAVNNVVYNNGDHGIDNKDVAGGTIVNNTVYNNSTAGINVEGTASHYTVENNVAVNNGGGLRSHGDIRVAQDATVAGNTTVDHNLVQNTLPDPAHKGQTLPEYDWDTMNVTGAPVGSGTNTFYSTSTAFHAGTGQGASDRNADPAFLGAPNFHIAANSPAAGLGLASAPNRPATDYDGNVWAGSAGAFNAGSTGPTSPLPPPPGSGPAVARVKGDDRYQTGIALSQKAFPNAHSAPAVVLATGDNFPDALAGVPLAKKLGAPLLLVPTAGPNAAVTDEVNRVLAANGKIYVLGGLAALPNANIAGMTGTKTRIAGNDRFDTAIQIAKVGLNSPKNVVLATGLNFADALAAGPYAADVYAGGGAAIILTNGAALAPGDAAYLAGATSISAVGGPAVTASATLQHVTDRIKGDDRYDTAKRIAATFSGEKAAGVATSGAANPKQFADALTGAAYLANAGGPLVLTDVNVLPVPSIQALNGIAGALGTAGTVTIFGGTAAVSDGVKAAVVTAVGGHAV